MSAAPFVDQARFLLGVGLLRPTSPMAMRLLMLGRRRAFGRPQTAARAAHRLIAWLMRGMRLWRWPRFGGLVLLRGWMLLPLLRCNFARGLIASVSITPVLTLSALIA